ncbi:copper chaperone PCu(A)C [Streptomyces sp. NBC_00876]|uniref:hypothetical protein n=1 Tax=Streptomyces sp. NBC_00876 TaxID=2975853 RepID=UPI0038687CA8|nr:copper chaperone PCu(A)C [Streptomyces sp. NBC_00876]
MSTPVSPDITSEDGSAWVKMKAGGRPAHLNIELKNSSDTDLKVTRMWSRDFDSIEVAESVISDEGAKMVRYAEFTIPAKGVIWMGGKTKIVLEKEKHIITMDLTISFAFFLSDGTVFEIDAPVRLT